MKALDAHVVGLDGHGRVLEVVAPAGAVDGEAEERRPSAGEAHGGPLAARADHRAPAAPHGDRAGHAERSEVGAVAEAERAAVGHAIDRGLEVGA